MLTTQENSVDAVAIRPDGRQVATAGVGGIVWLWDIITGSLVEEFRINMQSVAVLIFSPDGRRLAIGGSNNLSGDGKPVEVLDLTHSKIEPVGYKVNANLVSSLAFSPDGRRLAAGTLGDFDGKSVLVWDLDKPNTEPFSFHVSEGSVNALAFSPDSRRLATSYGENHPAVRLDNLAELGEGPVIVRGPPAMRNLVFSRDGHWLAVGTAIGTVVFWNMDLDDLLTRVGQTVGRNMTIEEWRQYFREQPYRPTFPSLPMPSPESRAHSTDDRR